MNGLYAAAGSWVGAADAVEEEEGPGNLSLDDEAAADNCKKRTEKSGKKRETSFQKIKLFQISSSTLHSKLKECSKT